VPLAGYLVVHLLSQASAFGGPLAYAARVGSPSLLSLVLEIALVYAPLLVHVSLGACRVASGQSEAQGEGAGGRALSIGSMQRLSALVLLVFLLSHIWQFRVRVWTSVITPSDYYAELCESLSTTWWGGVPLVAIGYLLGTAAAALHGALGLYRAGLTLRWVADGRQRLWGRCCAALAVSLFGLGALIVIDLATGSVLIHLRGS
jgi:hypothetical protein